MRRTGLTFAPEAGSWRLRQVINKLILEDDLYSRGRRRLLAGLAAGEALLPHRPADRDGRRHARDRRAREERHRRSAASTPSRRAARCRSAGSSRSRTRRSSGSARTAIDELRRKITLLRDATKGTRAQVKWHDPAATFAEGIASRGDRRIGRVIERVWRAGGTFQEWSEHFALDRWLDAMARRRSRPRLVRHPAPHPRRSAAVGPHRPPVCTRTSSGRTGRRRSPRTGSPIAAGRRATTVGCAPTTPSSTSWRRPSRPAGGSQGTGQELVGARRDPTLRCGSSARSPRFPRRERADAGHLRVPGPLDVHEAGQGPLDLASRRRPRDGAGVSHRGAPARVHRGVLAAAEGELRARAVDRARERRRVPRPRVRPRGRPRQLARDADRRAARRHRRHRGHTARGSRAGVARSRHRGGVERGRRERVRLGGRARRRGRVGGPRPRGSELPTERQRKGRTLTEDVRPVIRRIEVRPHDGGTEIVMELSTQPRSAKPGDILAAIERHTGSPGVLVEANARRTHQWIERDGTRWEPQDADTRPCAQEARAS